ncbi:branched-chain alpha-keto acid dehydrogenase subunit E2 [Haloprofundus marisrubri]|uniref:Branched-chain alpha-keto acid dehydrogenase subunit E2 n=1 Tax=Haloprofundus marisrubri TaxID=1514971 RepID=A0A0W1RDY2_9EURY|nr:dihydrolipoamide acetyltransferase family protein [Haloprofundus marisrubri]KTG11644.1 branched-chain alpha-keto acid dehydrogenase subunit E2 [Haloprofundus marisrubri]
MGVKEFKLPDVGEGVAEGELVSWLVEAGDTVSEDQAVAEVETDKALVEVPSPYNGTVKELLAEEGEVVPVGNVIITFEVEGEGDDVSAEPEPESEAEAESEEAETAVAGESAEKGADQQAETPKGRVFAAPSARRLARELDVDINAVDGSGPGGRVTDADVQAAANGRMDSGVEDSEEESDDGPRDVSTGGKKSAVSRRDDGQSTNGAAASSSAEAAGRDRTLAAPATRRMAEEEGVNIDDVPTDETRDGQAFVTPEAITQYAQAQREAREAEVQADAEAAEAGSAEAAEVTEEGVAERIPYRGIRRTIGQQMEKSLYTAPHVTHHDTTVVDELVDVRAEYKELAAERDVKLTYMPFVMKAIVAALREHPILNSTLDESDPDDAAILVRDDYNIGIAVATDAGLMVPVVKNVDEKSILQLSREVNDLASRARDRKVTREEMQGGTFTITNFGAIGGEYATPIINYPETAILGLGGIEKRPTVEESEDGDEVVAASTLPLSLSIDHRVIDGADAAAFTNTVMENLRNPKLLLLE